ncbi:chorismate--pyruvate lyase family protein [Thiobacter aerophilum]|uniref:Chorismate pyruvate-lyase family protein n=1 Tax=Thiobacter aerophilum TaxID=3121275 RepID=A0ABV0EFU2_9BURK
MPVSTGFSRSYFRTRGYVPGGIVINARAESLHMEALPPFLRTLLVTDGTVTKHLEAYFWEEVHVDNLGQAEVILEAAVPALGLSAGEQVLRRRVRLRGRASKRCYGEAESLIRLPCLPERLQGELAAGRIGIGELLRERGLETYREILDVGWAGPDAVYRTYRIMIRGEPTILITETFPCAPYR